MFLLMLKDNKQVILVKKIPGEATPHPELLANIMLTRDKTVAKPCQNAANFLQNCNEGRNYKAEG